MRKFGALLAATLLLGALGPLAGCSGAPPTARVATQPPAAPGTSGTSPAPSAVPPAASPPTFASTVATVTAADVPYTWRKGCPVGPAQLRKVTMSYWGFDNAPHTGTMIVNVAVVGDVTKVFRMLYDARFPIRKMQPVDAYKGSDPASMADDNTSSFNCRNAVAAGPPKWSVHAFGEAIDVNTVENPYLEGGTVMPAEGKPFVDRSDHRPGMAIPDGTLVNAFAAVGWQWGGRWADSPDYQHFSKTGG